MKIFIHLKNTEQDAQTLIEALRHFDGSVIIEEGNLVIVTSSIITGDVDLLDTDNIWNESFKIAEFIDIINGAAIVEGISLPPISSTKVLYEDSNGKPHILGVVGRMEGVLPSLRSSPPDISKMIPLALKDEAVAKALRLSSRELDWANLFRIYEVIKEDVGKFPKETHDKLNIFTTSVNKSSIVGDIARHGTIKDKGKPPKKTMTYQEAKQLIKTILGEWIHRKINH